MGMGRAREWALVSQALKAGGAREALAFWEKRPAMQRHGPGCRTIGPVAEVRAGMLQVFSELPFAGWVEAS